MKDEFAIIAVRCGLIIGLSLSALRIAGVVGISWVSIAGIMFGPLAIDVIVATTYIVWKVKLRPLFR